VFFTNLERYRTNLTMVSINDTKQTLQKDR